MKKLFRFLKLVFHTPDPLLSEPKIKETKAELQRREVICHRVRTQAQQNKVEAMTEFIDKIAANEDLDAFFLAVFSKAVKKGYRLQGTPEEMLRKLEANV
jgi:hypothetical protein